MHGIPVALKDLVDAEGVRTTCGSKLKAQHIPTADARLVHYLKEAVAISLGKTNLLEFAYGVVHPDFGPTLNPWNVGRTAGGSSGGSAAAVAAGLCCAAVGTDTGGSIRIPASYCGVLGFKPSYGLVDLGGIFPLSGSLDHAGPIARSSRDAAALLEALTGRALPVHGELSGLRFGTGPAYLERTEVQPTVLEAFRTAYDVFRSTGAKVVEVRDPDLERANDALPDLLLPEATVIHNAFPDNEEGYAPATREQLRQSLAVPATLHAGTPRRCPRPRPGEKERCGSRSRRTSLKVPSGCPFHTLCPHAFDRYPREKPGLLPHLPGHLTACHLYNDAEAKRPGKEGALPA